MFLKSLQCFQLVIHTNNNFKELKLTEKWAKRNGIPFPAINKGVYEEEGMKELYIFSDPTDPECPVVLHFTLVNMDFRKFKAPGKI